MSTWPLRMMIYGAGEAVRGTGALAPQIGDQLTRLAQVVTNRSIAGIAQLDSSSVPTRRFVLDPQGRQPVYEISNVNVGDPSELVSFASWSATLCPAQRSVLVLSGHGAAWEDAMVNQMLGLTRTRGTHAVPPVPGALHHTRRLFGSYVDPSSEAVRAILIDGQDRDFLSNAEFGAALSQIALKLGDKIDVLVLDACLMSSWEILQEMADSVKAVVASVDELSAAGIDLARPATTLSTTDGPTDANTIATTIANHFQPLAAFDSCAAIDLTNSGWAEAIAYFRAFCQAFLPWVQTSQANADAARSALRLAATSVVKFNSGGLADVAALAQAIQGTPGVPANAVQNIGAAAAALQGCVLALTAGRDYQSAMGISVFAPGSASTYRSNRADYVRLQFASLTGWAAVLDEIYGFGSDLVRFVPVEIIQPTVAGSADDPQTRSFNLRLLRELLWPTKKIGEIVEEVFGPPQTRSMLSAIPLIDHLILIGAKLAESLPAEDVNVPPDEPQTRFLTSGSLNTVLRAIIALKLAETLSVRDDTDSADDSQARSLHLGGTLGPRVGHKPIEKVVEKIIEIIEDLVVLR